LNNYALIIYQIYNKSLDVLEKIEIIEKKVSVITVFWS